MNPKLLTLITLIGLCSLVAAQTPFNVQLSVNGQNAMTSSFTIKPGETVNVQYQVSNALGHAFQLQKVEIDAQPPAIDAVIDQYTSSWANKQKTIESSFSESGIESIDLPSVLPAGNYQATAVIYYQDQGQDKQTAPYNFKFTIESDGIISSILGTIVKYTPRKVASFIMNLF